MTESRTSRIPLPDPVRILMLDLDGVLTDGGMYFDASGQAMKRFDVKDGLGLVRLADMDFPTAVVSGDHSAISAARCDVLRIKYVVLGRMDKETAVKELLEETGFSAESVVYVGDDISDLPAMHMVGLGVAPADAVDVVREQADWVTQRPGGHGAVREICDAIIEQLTARAHAQGGSG
ncbi:MAG: KdsC family phosphatase [Armatimonadota bacterium]